jgi:succinate-semialdehyde dehydrogenase/glutarate-semialdehyde dehydrogenase
VLTWVMSLPFLMPVSTGPSFAVTDPSTGAVLSSVADHSGPDALLSLGRSVAAAPGWAATPARERGEVMRRAFTLMLARREDLARLATLELGRALSDSLGEVTYAAEFFRWFSEEAARLHGQWAPDPAGGGARLVTIPRPVGPCLVITPWNFPLAMATRKLGPAFAAGCTVLWKPAAETPLSALALRQLLMEAGLPDGVLEVLTTSDPGALTEALLADPRLRKLSFTGSTPVGRSLAATAARRLLRVSLELGGNAPFVVFDDADQQKAAEDLMVAKMRNGGQSCVAANRLLLQRGCSADFVAGLVPRFEALVTGPGLVDGVDLGPLVSPKQRDTAAELVDDALAKGARIAAGGPGDAGPTGSMFGPTLLVDVAPDARLLHEEVFAPVLPVVLFDTEEQALALANDKEAGLVGYVHTTDLQRALRWMEQLQVGMIGVNRGLVSNPAAPFGGIKQSGYGKEGGSEGIREYLTYTYAAVQ